MKLFLSALLCVLLCGCAVEPEERSFVSAAGFGGGEVWELTLLTAEGSVDSGSNEKNPEVIIGSGESPSMAVNSCNKNSSGELFFGHTLVCVIDTSLLESRSRVAEMTEFMAKNTEISRRVIILAAEDIPSVIGSSKDGRNIADFVDEYYSSHKSERAVTLDTLCRALAEGGDALIPLVDSDGDINGGVLLADGSLKQYLTPAEVKCVSWLIDNGAEPSVAVDNGGVKTTVDIADKSVSTAADCVKVSVKLKTDDMENAEKIKTLALSQIKRQAQAGLEIIKENECDLVRMRHAYERAGREFKREDIKKAEVIVQ